MAGGGIACRLDERRLALLVPGACEPVSEQLRSRIEPGIELTEATWRTGESGSELVARALDAAPVS